MDGTSSEWPYGLIAFWSVMAFALFAGILAGLKDRHVPMKVRLAILALCVISGLIALFSGASWLGQQLS